MRKLIRKHQKAGTITFDPTYGQYKGLDWDSYLKLVAYVKQQKAAADAKAKKAKLATTTLKVVAKAKLYVESGKGTWRGTSGEYMLGKSGDYRNSQTKLHEGTIQNNKNVVESKQKVKTQVDKNNLIKKKQEEKIHARVLPSVATRKGFKQSTADIQKALWDAGMFNGITDKNGNQLTYEKAVDGLEGGMTALALAKAHELGYKYIPMIGLSKDGSINGMNIVDMSTNYDLKLLDMINVSPFAAQLLESAAKLEKLLNDPIYQQLKANSFNGTTALPVEVMYSPSTGALIPIQTPTSGSYSINNAAIQAAKDLVSSTVNRAGRNIFGDDVTLITRDDITDIPEDLKAVLKEQIRSKGTNSGGWTGNDWRNYQGTYTAGNRSVWDRMATPLGNLEHTLGQYNWHTDPDGNIIVTDTYDFNVGERTGGEGFYTKVRDFMGEHGTSSADPDKGKSHYKINLGKL